MAHNMYNNLKTMTDSHNIIYCRKQLHHPQLDCFLRHSIDSSVPEGSLKEMKNNALSYYRDLKKLLCECDRLPRKYRENFDVSSEGRSSGS